MMCFRAYEFFKLAAERGHHKAKEYLGFGMLLGDHMNLDPEAAMAIFQELSAKGSPKGQLVSPLKFSIFQNLHVPNSSSVKCFAHFYPCSKFLTIYQVLVYCWKLLKL